ncbi:MAG: ABC transporter substrate-binding protein [Vulcanimicrobiaceae bacterium]
MIKPLALACAALFLGSCASGTAGTSHEPSRIVSLIPSLTEDLCELGAGKALVGVSQFSDRIACAEGIPVVGGFSSLDAEKIVALHPDVVVGIPSQRRMTDALRQSGVTTAFFRDDTYDDIFTDIAGLGKVTGRDDAAASLIAKLHAQTAALQASQHFKRRPTVFVALGTGPIWTVGPQSYLSTIIALAGGRNAVKSLPGAYAEYSAEALVAMQPDAIVTDRFTRLDAVLDREPWRSLRAVREHHIFVAPDEFERPGPYYNEGIRWLTERLRPLAT